MHGQMVLKLFDRLSTHFEVYTADNVKIGDSALHFKNCEADLWSILLFWSTSPKILGG